MSDMKYRFEASVHIDLLMNLIKSKLDCTCIPHCLPELCMCCFMYFSLILPHAVFLGNIHESVQGKRIDHSAH